MSLASQDMLILRRMCALVTALSVATACFGQTEPTATAQDFLEELTAPWEADLNGLIEIGVVRVATVFDPLLFTYDTDGKALGIVSDRAREFEAFLNAEFAAEGQSVDVFVVAVPRDDLLSAVARGEADIADGNITITAERSEDVDFTSPLFDTVTEVIVTGPAAPDIQSFDDLAASGVHLAPDSSHVESLHRLNEIREAAGQTEIPVFLTNPNLGDHDRVDLVARGVWPATVVDSHRAEVWQDVFPDITVHPRLVLREDAEIAWAVRKNAPELRRAAERFVGTVKRGTLTGNVIINRYFSDPEIIERLRTPVLDDATRESVDLLTIAAEAYGFDWRLIVAQAYQESKLDQSLRSSRGAVGIMQVLPSTAADPNVAISDIHIAENNIEAGVKYLAFLRDRYFSDPAITPFDSMLLSLAAYNAGPANLVRARNRADAKGFDPNVWFDNVEVAVGEEVGSEPIRYVRSIFRYSVAIATFGEQRAVRDTSLPAVE